MFAAKYQLNRVIVAILNCASFHSLCCLMNRKGKSLNKQCFYWNNKIFSGINSYNTCSNEVYRRWHSPTIVLSVFYCPVDDNVVRCHPRNLLFRCVKSLLLLWKPHNWFWANLKTFYHSQWKIQQGISVPKIITECCDLVKLCHINCRHTVERASSFLTAHQHKRAI